MRTKGASPTTTHATLSCPGCAALWRLSRALLLSGARRGGAERGAVRGRAGGLVQLGASTCRLLNTSKAVWERARVRHCPLSKWRQQAGPQACTVFPRYSEPRNSENPAYSERRRSPRSLATQIHPATANIHYGYSERQRPLSFTVCRRAVVSAFGTAWGPLTACGACTCRQPPAPAYAPYPLSLQHLPLLTELISELNEGRTLLNWRVWLTLQYHRLPAPQWHPLRHDSGSVEHITVIFHVTFATIAHTSELTVWTEPCLQRPLSSQKG
jgi:hypothetical protein